MFLATTVLSAKRTLLMFSNLDQFFVAAKLQILALLGWLPGMFIFGLVGLLLLRVSLHSQATENVEDTSARYPIVAYDVIKALGMAVRNKNATKRLTNLTARLRSA